MRRADGVKVIRLTPGGLFVCHRLVTLRGVVRGEQKSTEAEVAAAHGSEGPYTGAEPVRSVRCSREAQPSRLRSRSEPGEQAVDRPQRRQFLGYSVTVHREAKLKVAPRSAKRLKVQASCSVSTRAGPYLVRVCEELSILLCGWVAYYRISEVKARFEALDAWIRRELRVILWRQWKRPRTRERSLSSEDWMKFVQRCLPTMVVALGGMPERVT
jgi:hypothetical protein